MITVSMALAWARNALKDVDNPILEAQLLLSNILQCDRVKLIAWPEMALSSEQEITFREWVERRARHEPIAYLLGEKEFWSHTFYVTPDTLIPRPDTEKLVEVVLDTLPQESLTLVDLGTGCGAIACALALSRPQWRVIGVDISEAAINVATLNAKRLNVPNVEWRHSSWLESFDEQSIDAIVSNPPYLQAEDEHLQGPLLFEPLGALVSGKTGFEAYEAIIAQVPRALKKGGRLFFEHGFSQAQGIRSRLEQAGFQHLQTYEDLSGHSRVTQGIFNLALQLGIHIL